MKQVKTIYYTDELNDEFSKGGITARTIDDSYDYGGTTKQWKRRHFFWYRIVAVMMARVYMRIVYRHKVIGREKLPLKDRGGVFLFGNHTNEIPDAFIPTLLTRPRDMYVIVHPDNVSMPGLGRVTPYMGAIPLPGGGRAMRHFMDRIKSVIAAGDYVTIYPEAHIWPFYTHIRPFPSASFSYPVSMATPVYCFTNTYQKCRRLLFRNKPRMVTYIDGPFYSDTTLSNSEAKEKLRNEVYETMVERSSNNTVEMIHYERRA